MHHRAQPQTRATTSTGLFYWEPATPPTACNVSEGPTAVAPIVPIHLREHLGNVLSAEGKTRGVEVGTKDGAFAGALLQRWGRRCESYLLVDRWRPQSNYVDAANDQDQEKAMANALRLRKRHPVSWCRDDSVACASRLANASVDFVYLDARHDYASVLADLNAYWPKLRRGGLMAGHDYVWATEGGRAGGNGRDDWTINSDGTRDPFQRAVKGAVDEFFTRCVPRQVAVTYREGNRHTWDVFNTWYVRK